jgi:hypothetical protein
MVLAKYNFGVIFGYSKAGMQWYPYCSMKKFAIKSGTAVHFAFLIIVRVRIEE